MTRDDEALCCCEYYTYQGERAHLLGLCCDCEALDSAVDGLVKGGGLRSDKVREILDNVTNFTVEFNTGGSETGEAAWHDSYLGETLPKGIRITITLADMGDIQRVFALTEQSS